MDSKLNTKNSLAFLKKNKKVLAITFVVSAIAATGISLLLPNYYKSQVLLLPSAVNSVSKSILNEGDKLDPYIFGTEKESEYILELLGSGEIIGKTVQAFNLKEHYGIKYKGDFGNDIVNRKLQKNIKIKRTEFLGVRLTVWDEDPKYAANIANYMAEQLSCLRYQMKKAKADSIRVCLERSKSDLQQEYLRYIDSLQEITTKSNVYAPHPYADRLIQEMAKQIAVNNVAGVQRLENKMAHLIKYATEIDNYNNIIKGKLELLQKWDDHYKQALVDLEANIPNDYIAEHAVVAENKDKPKRSIIVLISALMCTIIAAEVLVLRRKHNSSTTKDE